MRFNVIASGSKGNCTILEDAIAIDMGVKFSDLSPYLSTLKLVLLTHKHRDHFLVATIKKLVKKTKLYFACGKHLEEECLEVVPKERLFIIPENKEISLGIAFASCFPLTHDVPNVGWKIYMNNQKCIYATDTSNLEGITAKNFDLFLIEANYETAELIQRYQSKVKKGEYAYEKRVSKTHLSKEQCDEFLRKNMGEKSVSVYMHKHV